MHTPLHTPGRLNAARAADCAALACATLMGCATADGLATPLGNGWADYKSRKEIEKVAADNSFPTAAQAGLLDTAQLPTTTMRQRLAPPEPCRLPKFVRVAVADCAQQDYNAAIQAKRGTSWQASRSHASGWRLC